MELEVRWAASRPALAVRFGRVESPPASEQLRALAEAGAPQPAREARALPVAAARTISPVTARREF